MSIGDSLSIGFRKKLKMLWQVTYIFTYKYMTLETDFIICKLHLILKRTLQWKRKDINRKKINLAFTFQIRIRGNRKRKILRPEEERSKTKI